MRLQRLACGHSQQRYMHSCKGTAKTLCFRGIDFATTATGIPKAQGAHPAPAHRLRLALDPREPQAHPERNTADLDPRDLGAVPPDALAHAAAPERAPAARRVLGAKVEQRRGGGGRE